MFSIFFQPLSMLVMFFSYTPDITPKFDMIFRIWDNSVTLFFSVQFCVTWSSLLCLNCEILCSYLLTFVFFGIMCSNSLTNHIYSLFLHSIFSIQCLNLSLLFLSSFFPFESVDISSQVGNITFSSSFPPWLFSLLFCLSHTNYFQSPKGCCHSKFVSLSYIVCFNMSYHCITFLSYISLDLPSWKADTLPFHFLSSKLSAHQW